MRISKNWLSDYVDIDDISDERLEELITTRVAEVDELEARQLPEPALWARITDVSPIPEKTGLSKVRLFTGAEEVDVVCGAANVRIGELAAYLPPGSSLTSCPDSGERIHIEAKAIAGIHSQGMLASEAELGLSSECSGVLLGCDIFPESQGIVEGASLAQTFGQTSCVLVIDNKSLTHRPDLWGHSGFARELSAILGRPLKLKPDEWADDEARGRDFLSSLGGRDGRGRMNVSIAKGSGCRRFSALQFTGITNSKSPFWLRHRLFSVGAGSRNLLVDLSNYVMHDVGQPNHAYDLSRLVGDSFEIRRALSGELFLGLDDLERTLTEDDLVVADGLGPVALAGVIGGSRTAIGQGTGDVVIESANFDPVIVRLMTKRHQLRTDASNRFEKGRSPYAVPLAQHRFAELLCELSPSTAIVGQIADSFPERPSSVSVGLDLSLIRRRLGIELGSERIKEILVASGFGVMPNLQDGVEVRVPYFRAGRDVSCAEDLVEEIGRIHGYENIPEVAPQIPSEASHSPAMNAVEDEIRDYLAGAGLSEYYDYSFMGSQQAADLGIDITRAVALENTLDSNQELLRTSLVPGLIRVAQRNLKHRSSLAMFELGRTYYQLQGEGASVVRDGAENSQSRSSGDHINIPANERRMLGLVYSCELEEEVAGQASLPQERQGSAFYSLAAIVRKLANFLHVDGLKLEPLDGAQNLLWSHPHRAAKVVVNAVPVGVVSEIRPDIIPGLKNRVVLAELDLQDLVKHRRKSAYFVPFARFPDSFFEVSVVMPEEDTFSKLESVLKEAVPETILKDLNVCSVYRGRPMIDGQKSVSVRLTFSSDERTLKPDEITAFQQSVMKAVYDSGYSLRS